MWWRCICIDELTSGPLPYLPLNRFRIIALVALVMLLPAASAMAASFDELVMPGKVIEGHAEYETQCKKCHQPFSKEAQAQLCRDCHEKVDKDIVEQAGFHGRISGIEDMECKHCHSDHLGRGADVVQLDRETFNHERTDFALKDAHQTVACDRCHTPEKKFREAPKACFDCHEDYDPHQGHLGEECDDCHDERSWVKTEFDHKDTDFPLQDEHKDVLCNACHPNDRYKKTPKTCHACHQINDIHQGRYGKKCDSCHTPKTWDEPTFNHDTETDYKLESGHQDVACDTCHISDDLYDEKTPTTCYGCHQNDDEHNKGFGEKCDDCHASTEWDKIEFDHDKDTDFELKGDHQDLDCKGCHRGTIDKDKERATDCLSCHRQDDVHEGQEGKLCESCHNESGWENKVVFEHDLTLFPLIGLHAVTPCEECHLGSRFQDAALDCKTCHKQDDEHKKTLGPRCESCHNPNAWGLWVFDHNTQTDFELDGAHEGLACDSCHQRTVRTTIKLSSACGHCHQQDDIHDGGFGPHCVRCHTTEAFNAIRIEK